MPVEPGRLRALLLAPFSLLLLAACGDATGPSLPVTTGTLTVDATPLLVTADSFNLVYDKITVVVRQSGVDSAIVFQSFSGAEISARPTLLSVQVPVAEGGEDFVVGIHAFRDEVPYFMAHDSGTLVPDGTLTLTHFRRDFAGEGWSNDLIDIGADTALTVGDSVLLTARVTHHGVEIDPVPHVFLSSDTTVARIHRPAGLPFNQAWVVGVSGTGSATITARLPDPDGPQGMRQIGVEAAFARSQTSHEVLGPPGGASGRLR